MASKKKSKETGRNNPVAKFAARFNNRAKVIPNERNKIRSGYNKHQNKITDPDQD